MEGWHRYAPSDVAASPHRRGEGGAGSRLVQSGRQRVERASFAAPSSCQTQVSEVEANGCRRFAGLA